VPDILWAILAAVMCLLVGVLLGILFRKRVAEAKIGSAEQEAKRIVAEALKTSETKKKELLLEAKEEILRAKNEADREIKERRREITNTENRLAKKEETLDRKSESLERKEELLAKKLSKVETQSEEIKRLIAEQRSVLERLAGLTCEQAKEELMRTLDEELQHETAMKISAYEQQFKEEADIRAKNILSLAIQRCAADHVSEMTVSVVNLPNEEMKGRIIGREGRNVRTIETLTGVDLIIDDTPEVITISGFDPIRRDIARIAIEKLITDGRIHPARIEEMVEKAHREVDASIKQAGERATFDTGVHGINQDKLWSERTCSFNRSFSALRHPRR
jgi:ribonuclease Y